MCQNITNYDSKFWPAVAYLAQTGSEDYDLVDLPHLLQEIVDARTLYNVDVVPVILDLDGHDIVGLVY